MEKKEQVLEYVTQTACQMLNEMNINELSHNVVKSIQDKFSSIYVLKWDQDSVFAYVEGLWVEVYASHHENGWTWVAEIKERQYSRE